VFDRESEQNFDGPLGMLPAVFANWPLIAGHFDTVSESLRPAFSARPSRGSRNKESSRRTHTVLVVDDEAGIRESLRLILEPHYRVLTADTGEAALGILERERISVMTLDLRMPGWDGLETPLRVREIEAALEVIIVSA
jgi:PleD family two-component response regulator